jgi:hypothetical protein
VADVLTKSFHGLLCVILEIPIVAGALVCALDVPHENAPEVGP